MQKPRVLKTIPEVQGCRAAALSHSFCKANTPMHGPPPASRNLMRESQKVSRRCKFCLHESHLAGVVFATLAPCRYFVCCKARAPSFMPSRTKCSRLLCNGVRGVPKDLRLVPRGPSQHETWTLSPRNRGQAEYQDPSVGFLGA